jgi:hypothetical protein
MKTWIQKALASVTALGVGAMMLGTAAKAEDAPIMTYGVDIVSDYVFRGTDLYVRQFKDNEHSAFHVAPAAQPSATFFGPSGISLNLWGSFATGDRADDNKTGFLGLGRDDELDYTLAFDWSNRLGGFTAAIIYYTYFHQEYQTETVVVDAPSNTKATKAVPVQPDALFKWTMPFAKSINPYFSHYASPTHGASYDVLGISGGESVVWAASVGNMRQGIKDVTGKVGYVMGDFSVALNAAYRPNPELVGPYDKDGKYFVKGEEKTYPSTIAWLSLSYSGSVAAK